MTDIVLDNANNDITIENSDFKLFEQGDNALIAQRLEIKLRVLKGEWFRDINNGMPYYQEILNEANNSSIADTYIKKTIVDDPDILSISYYQSQRKIDSDNIFKVTFEAILLSGIAVPFTLEV